MRRYRCHEWNWGPLLWPLTHLLLKMPTNICKWYTLSLEMAAVGAAFLHRISFSFGAWVTEYLLMCGNIYAALLHRVCCVLDEIEIDQVCCFFSFFSISVHFQKMDTSPTLRHHWEPWCAVVSKTSNLERTHSQHLWGELLLENYIYVALTDLTKRSFWSLSRYVIGMASAVVSL